MERLNLLIRADTFANKFDWLLRVDWKYRVVHQGFCRRRAPTPRVGVPTYYFPKLLETLNLFINPPWILGLDDFLSQKR